MDYSYKNELRSVANNWNELLGGLSPKKQQRLADILKPYYDLKEIEQATQFYIPTRFDSTSDTKPHEEQLIPYLLNTRGVHKHYLVLANSGLGKTTFLLNLFQVCSFDKKYRQPVELFPLRDPAALRHVSQVKAQSQTLLLLDGLNEDPLAINNYAQRLQQLIEATKDFGKVIITSRSQFFSHEIGMTIEQYMRKEVASESLPIHCIYISAFNQEEVKKYIRKKYPVWNRQKRKRAAEIIEQAPVLMEQPLLLSFAEDILDTQRSYRRSYEIYEDLIATWIAQASYPQSPARRQTFQVSLNALMRDISLSLYKKHLEGLPLFLNEQEVGSLIDQHGFHQQELHADGRSIVNYYQGQGYKFSHNSIMEYFIAHEVYSNPTFFKEISFAGLDQAQHFFKELIQDHMLVEVEGGSVTLGNDERVELETFMISRFPIRVGEYLIYCEATGQTMPEPPSWGWESGAPILGISWQEATEYCQWFSYKTGLSFRLPTEAEWEYAARGGQKKRRYEFSGSKNLQEVGWFAKNAERKTHPVGQLKPNTLGIYEMSGNAWEWCQDWYQSYTATSEESSQVGRVIRGGSWLNHENSCKVDTRGYFDPNHKSNIISFRMVCKPE